PASRGLAATAASAKLTAFPALPFSSAARARSADFAAASALSATFDEATASGPVPLHPVAVIPKAKPDAAIFISILRFMKVPPFCPVLGRPARRARRWQAARHRVDFRQRREILVEQVREDDLRGAVCDGARKTQAQVTLGIEAQRESSLFAGPRRAGCFRLGRRLLLDLARDSGDAVNQRFLLAHDLGHLGSERLAELGRKRRLGDCGLSAFFDGLFGLDIVREHRSGE